MEIDDKSQQIFCPYCGQSFLLDNEKKEQVITKNVNINKTVTKRYIDDAKIIKEKTKAKESIWESISVILIVFGILLAYGIMMLVETTQERKAIESGLISVGYHSDFENEHYKVVVSQFESMGFDNIKTIDLNDAGLFKNKEDTVKTVSVGGKTNFTNNDYFSKTDQVIISYH